MQTYTRKNNVIKTLDKEGKVIETVKYDSINKAKKASFKLQKENKGKLGNGIIKVIPGKQFSPSVQKALWKK